MSLKTGSRWSNWAWDKPVKAFIWRSSRMCRPIGGLPPWFFEDSLPHLLLRNNSNDAADHRNRDVFEEQVAIFKAATANERFAYRGTYYTIPPEGLTFRG